MPQADRRRLVPLRVLELAVKRDHPLPPPAWASVRKHARAGTEAPDELRAAVRADADAILHSSDLGIAPGWLPWGMIVLAVLFVASWTSTRSTVLLVLAAGYLLLAAGAVLARNLRRARAETALLRNAEPW